MIDVWTEHLEPEIIGLDIVGPTSVGPGFMSGNRGLGRSGAKRLETHACRHHLGFVGYFIVRAAAFS